VVASAGLAAPVSVALGGLAWALGWVPGDGLDVAVAGALAGLTFGVVAATVALAEHVLGKFPVKTLDHCAVAGALTLVVAALLLRLGLSQIVYAFASLRDGPLAGLEASVAPRSAEAVRWLYDPSSLCALAAPFAALAAVRGDEDDRPLGREVALVAGIAAAGGALSGITLWLLSPFGPSTAPSAAARVFVVAVVPPVLGAVFSLAARLAARVERRFHAWLVPDAP
jgi:hypothetical protein